MQTNSTPRHIDVPKDALVVFMKQVAEKVGDQVAAKLPGYRDLLIAIGIDEATQLLNGR